MSFVSTRCYHVPEPIGELRQEAVCSGVDVAERGGLKGGEWWF